MKYRIPVSVEKEAASMLHKHVSLQSWLRKEQCGFFFSSFFFGLCSKY